MFLEITSKYTVKLKVPRGGTNNVGSYDKNVVLSWYSMNDSFE